MDEQNINTIWVKCPLCGSETRTKIYKDTVLLNFPLYCLKCKKEFCIDVVRFKIIMSKELDAYSTETAST